MTLQRYVCAFALTVFVSAAGTSAVIADGTAVSPVSRVEVVLANQFKNQVTAVSEEFAQAGLTNVHFQFARLGQPPQNIGFGRDVPADKAREAIRLALKYNLGVGILLPERLFPPRFVTIASSNYDDTVESKIDQAALVQLQNPALSTAEFHELYRTLTAVPSALPGRFSGRY